MKKYLSHGMGVNSTALMLILEDRGEDFESVFVNHGCDYPETYKYIEYLRENGHDITIIIPNCYGYHSIEDYAIRYNFFPGVRARWCSFSFKIKPLHQYFQKPCIDYVGIDGGESYRYIKEKNKVDDIYIKYPLLEQGVDREGCKKIILDHDLLLPKKSHCWCCPYMTHQEVRRLFLEDHDLFEKRAKFEEKIMKHQSETKKPFFLSSNRRSVRDEGMELIPPLSSYM